MSEYDHKFYKDNIENTGTAPEKIFNVLAQFFEIDSLCDIGCSVGVWGSEFLRIKGITEDQDAKLVCIDGDYVDRKMMLIPEKYFRPFNLENRIDLGEERFDLVMTLEVAEHLSPSRADSFVEDLTKLSDIVLFSAAVEGQGGTHHVNEQYMPYWVEKFEKLGYAPFDLVRPAIQFDLTIPWYYRQNMVVFVKKDTELYDRLVNEFHAYPPLQRMVCIECYEGDFKILKRMRSGLLGKVWGKLRPNRSHE